MKICITLDDVIRATSKQFGKMYKKYIDENIDLENLDFSTNDYSKIFPFKDKEEMYNFLYRDYSFEVLGEADVVEKMLDKKLNLWHIDLANDYPDVELIIANPYEFNNTIGYTYFFLSKIATHVRNVYLPEKCLDIWNQCDVLITAEPKLLEHKPEGKISIKIDMPYNDGCDSDYKYESLSAFLDDNEIISTLTNC